MKLKIILSCCLIALGAAAMYQFGPRRIQLEEKTVVKDKIVTVVREIKRPDGTVERDERIEKDSSQTITVPLPEPRPDWLIGISASPTISNKYSAFLGRRIIGNAFITISATTQGELLVGALIEF